MKQEGIPVQSLKVQAPVGVHYGTDHFLKHVVIVGLLDIKVRTAFECGVYIRIRRRSRIDSYRSVAEARIGTNFGYTFETALTRHVQVQDDDIGRGFFRIEVIHKFLAVAKRAKLPLHVKLAESLAEKTAVVIIVVRKHYTGR